MEELEFAVGRSGKPHCREAVAGAVVDGRHGVVLARRCGPSYFQVARSGRTGKKFWQASETAAGEWAALRSTLRARPAGLAMGAHLADHHLNPGSTSGGKLGVSSCRHRPPAVEPRSSSTYADLPDYADRPGPAASDLGV
jgi:hypothetical protein